MNAFEKIAARRVLTQSFFERLVKIAALDFPEGDELKKILAAGDKEIKSIRQAAKKKEKKEALRQAAETTDRAKKTPRKMSGGKKALLAALGTGVVGATTYGVARGLKARKAAKAAKANAEAKAKLKRRLKIGGGAAAATGGLAGLAALGLSD